MLSALLAGLVMFSLFIGRVPQWALALLTCSAFLFFLLLRHDHGMGQVLTMDVLARRSRLANLNPDLKLWGSILLLILAILAKSPLPPLGLLLVVTCLTTLGGGLHLHDYLRMFSLPAVFLLVSAVALLWDFSPAGEGVLALPCFGRYLVITEDAQNIAMLVLARALGAVSCLYFLSLSTPMPELIAAMERVKIPSILISLAFLIYRYIFILLETFHDMRDAAASRLGFGGLRRSLKTTGLMYMGLLAGSFRRASACFDAMESRLYTGEIHFLSPKKPVRWQDILILILLAAGMIAAEVIL